MRDMFQFVNIKKVCEDRGLPYKVILDVIFGKRRLEKYNIDDKYIARIAAVVTYNKKTRLISKIQSTIILTTSDSVEKVICNDKGVIYAKKKYRVDIPSLPYYKDVKDEFQKMLNSKDYKDKYEKYILGGVDSVWNDFFDRMNQDVIDSQRKFPKYTFILHYLELQDIENLTGIKLSDYTDKVVAPRSARLYINFLIQENIRCIMTHIFVDDILPKEYKDAVTGAIDNLATYIDELEVTGSIVRLLTNEVFLKLDNKRELYTTDNEDNNYVADASDLKEYNIRLYNKFMKLREIQYNGIREAFSVVVN